MPPSPAKTPVRPGSAKRSPKSPGGMSPVGAPRTRPQSAGTRRTEVHAWEETVRDATSARPRSPLRRPVSAIGKAMRRHLDDLWEDPGAGLSTRRSPSPIRVLRALQEEENTVKARAREVGRQSFSVIDAHSAAVRTLCLGPSFGYSAGMDGLIKVWDFASLLEVQGAKGGSTAAVQEFAGHAAGVSSLCIVSSSEHGRLLLCSGGWDSTAKVWDMSMGHAHVATLKGHSEFVRAVAGDVGMLYTGSNDRTIRAWDLTTFKCVSMLTGHSLAVMSLAIANKRLFSGGYDLLIKVWDTETNLCLMDIGGHQQVITHLSVSRTTKVHQDTGEFYDYFTVFSCAEDNVVAEWDAHTLTCKRQLHLGLTDVQESSSVSALPSAPQPPGDSPTPPFVTCKEGMEGVLYVGDRGGGLQQWDLESEECVGRKAGPVSSVRAMAVLHAVPFQHSLVLTGCDDGTIRAWKRASLISTEKEGMRLDGERRAAEEHEAKRRAKEAVEMERQRQKRELARMKAQEDEQTARGLLHRVQPKGMQSGEQKWSDWNFFDGYLCHKSRMTEITVWSVGYVHGLQCGFKREVGERSGKKADKHAVDKGKEMPTANQITLKDDEDITAVHWIVSENMAKGVVGQIRIKTRRLAADGSPGDEAEYKFGRTTDGKEHVMTPPEGYRLLCLTGSHDDSGLRELGGVFVPKALRAHKADVGATLTLCGRARITFGMPHKCNGTAMEGRVMAVDGAGRLAAMAAEGQALLDSVLVLDGDGDQFALRTTRKGQYLSLHADGSVGCKMSGWGAFTANEIFEVVVEETDEGARVSVRAANGKFLAVDHHTGFVMADKDALMEDEVLPVLPRSTEGQLPILEPAGKLRIGSRTLEELDVLNRQQFCDRARNCQRALLRALLAEEGIHRLSQLGTHVWDGARLRLLLELPTMLARIGSDFAVTHRTQLMRNLFYAAAVARAGALDAYVVFLQQHAAVVGEASLEVPVPAGNDTAPAAAASAAVNELLTFIKAQGVDLYREPHTLLTLLLNNPNDTPMGDELRADVECVKVRVHEAISAADSAQADIVAMMAAKRRLVALQEVGAVEAMQLTQKCRDAVAALDEKMAARRAEPDQVMDKFAQKYLRSQQDNPRYCRNRVCPAEAFDLLADALYSAHNEDEAYLAVVGGFVADENGQTAAAVEVKNAVWADAASVVPSDSNIEVELVSFDAESLTAVLRFVKYGSAGLGSAAEPDRGAQAEGGEGGIGNTSESGDGGAGSVQKEGSVQTDSEKHDKDKKGKGAKGVKGGKKTQKLVAAAPRTQVSRAKDAMGVRDFLRTCILSKAKVGAGAIKDLAHGQARLHEASIFVAAASPEDTAWERAGLTMSVLPALRRRLQKHGIDLTWQDWHHLGSLSSPNTALQWFEPLTPGQPARRPFGAAQVAVPGRWRSLEALDACTLPVPDGTRRPFALLLLGNAPSQPLPEIDEYILGERLSDSLPSRLEEGVTEDKEKPASKPKGAAVVRARPSLIDLLLARLGVGDGSGRRLVARQLLATGVSVDVNEQSPLQSPRVSSPTPSLAPTTASSKGKPPGKQPAASEKSGVSATAPIRPDPTSQEGARTEGGEEQGQGLAGEQGDAEGFMCPCDRKVVCEPLCFVKEKAALKTEIVAREVPATARYWLDADVAPLPEIASRRQTTEATEARLLAVKTVPGVVSKYDLKYRALAPRSGPGADKTLCWATVHVSGLPGAQTADGAHSKDDFVQQAQLVSDALQFELPARFTLEEIDLSLSYLCNRGQNAVVTYKGERAQLAAALATQKTQIRMASNVRVTLKGCDVSALPQANAACDDHDMTLLQVGEIPAATSEGELMELLALPLAECNVHSSLPRSDGEHTGVVELIYDSTETALRIQRGFQGLSFKLLRPPTAQDPITRAPELRLTRADSDPVGYLKATGLPYNVMSADVLAFFDVRAAPEWSRLRPHASVEENQTAVLAMRHWHAAALLVKHFDRSRAWGMASSSLLTVEMVEPASALRRVFASQVPFAMNDKLKEEDKIRKDMAMKEKDLLQNMLSLPVRPVAASSAVFCKQLPASKSVAYTFDGEAYATFVHEDLGKMAIANSDKEKQVQLLGKALSMRTASTPRALCAAIEYMQEDLCKMLLASYNALRSTASRMMPELAASHRPLAHALLVQDQKSSVLDLARRACVAGYSMTSDERSVLLRLLKDTCQVFRGVEKEWIMVDAVVQRHELRYQGDGVHNNTHRAVLDAIEEKKRPVVAVYGPAGCGKSCLLARIVKYMHKVEADKAQKLREEAEAAKSKKKKAVAPKPATGGGGGDKKKKDMGPAMLPAQTCLVSFFVSPWHSLRDCLMFVLQEVLGPVASEQFLHQHPDRESILRDTVYGKDLEMRQRMSECTDAEVLGVFCEGLEAFFNAGLNRTVGLVLDGFGLDGCDQATGQALLGRSQVFELAEALQALKHKSTKAKVWCVASMRTANEDETLDGRELLQAIKIPALSKPEATAVMYAALKEFGPHLLRRPISFLMRMFKGQSGNPRYLRTLVQLTSMRTLPSSIVSDLDAMQDTLQDLYPRDFLPALETELNPGAALFPGVSTLLKRTVGGVGSAAPDETGPVSERRTHADMQPVERVLRLLYTAGNRGVFVSDLPALVTADGGDGGLPDRVLHPLMAQLRPHLYLASSHGETRLALVNEHLREAVRTRYWPAALVLRGTGCNQAVSRLRPLCGPLRAVFGRAPGTAPLIIIDVEDPRRLDTVKRVILRWLMGWSAGASPGAAGLEALDGSGGMFVPADEPGAAGFKQFNLVSCQADATHFSDAMVKVDANGAHVRAAAAWLLRLGVPLVGGLGLQSKDKEPPPLIPRCEWTDALERIAEVGRGCDKIYLLSDRLPGLSVERILDEVQQLNDEVGHGWEAKIDCVSLDASPQAARMLRRVAAQTGGRFSRLSSFILRQQLLWNWPTEPEREISVGDGDATPRGMSLREEIERISGCLPPAVPHVPLLTVRNQMRLREGNSGGGGVEDLLLEGGRSVVLVLNGEGESHLGRFGARTGRGLHLTIFNRDWSEKLNCTFDTWGSVAEANSLANELSKCTSSETVIVTSFDAWERCFNHPLAQALSGCGIDGREMLKHCEEAKTAWEKLYKALGCDPGDDARPQGHGHPVAAIGIAGRRPWGKTVVGDDLTRFGSPADLTVDLGEIAAARLQVEESDKIETGSRAVGVCKVVTPMRYHHQVGDGAAYNTLPGHAFTSPSQQNKDGSKTRPANTLNVAVE